MFTKQQTIEGLRLILLSELECDKVTYIKNEQSTLFYNLVNGSEEKIIKCLPSSKGKDNKLSNKIQSYHIDDEFCLIGDIMIAYYEQYPDENEEE